jgi:carotenoid cleavage dioxygenase-like enzyme
MSKLIEAFKSVEKEFSSHKLKPEISNLPKWFNSQVVRVGPAKFEYGNINLNHWFDGLAMLYGFDKIGSDIYFTNKFLRSEQYKSSLRGKMSHDEFGTRVSSKLSRLSSMIKSIIGVKVEKPSCNVNILSIKNKLLATTEVTSMIEFDRTSLDTVGEFVFNDDLKGQFSCAHPQVDPKTGEQFNFVVNISKECKYTIYKTSEGSDRREELYSFSNAEFIYNHSLFLTTNYLIIPFGPLRAKPMDFLTKPISEVIKLDKEADCEILVLNRNTLKVNIIESPSFLYLHSINAFEKNNKIHLDFVEYTNCDVAPYQKLYFDNIRNEDCLLSTQISRITIDLEGYTLTRDVLINKNVEFPRINESFSGKEYRYIYLSNKNDSMLYNSIIKVDVESKKVIEQKFGENFVSEPIFIANPTATTEDDGLVFVNIIDIDKKLSFIVYLDAKSLEIAYKAYLPIQMPLALHGVGFQK